ncbi:hypothetical protein ACFFRR_010435 [Megaselia abdita]
MKVFVALASLLVVAAASPFEGRITQGELAEPGQFPYQVGLSLHIKDKRAWCGGSLISNRHIITAAHCTDSADGVDVTIGTNDIKDPERQVIYVSKANIKVHEKWIAALIKNDIAIITLPAPIRFNKYIQPVALPKKSNTYSSYDGQEGFASGWGKISDKETSVTDLLRFIEAPIMGNSACSRYYGGNVGKNQICIRTKGTHKSTCNGDSGGPLVVHDLKEGPVLVGLTSFGTSIGCESGFPGVFTRITSFLDWIEKNSGISY